MHKRIVYFHSILLSLILVWPELIGAQESFYKGKTLRIIIGTSAGGCWTWDSIRSTWSKAIQSGEAIVVLQALSKPHPDLLNVPLAQSLAKTEEARQLIQAGVQDPADFYRPYVAPPSTPKSRVEVLRQAFDATMKDAEFLADAKKANIDIEPITGQETGKLVAGIFKLDPMLAAKLKSILNPS
jgi:hypothetical protein